MANSDLQGKYWEIDDNMSSHLNKIYNAYRGDKTVKGYNRLKGLLDTRECSYEQMKRIKNFFDTFNGNKNDTPYLLNGGTKMKEWINTCLDTARQDIKGKKKSMERVGMTNQFQKDGGTKNQDSSGKRIRTDNISKNAGIYECKLFGNLLNIIDENNKTIKNL
jgi:hypothetical protein